MVKVKQSQQTSLRLLDSTVLRPRWRQPTGSITLLGKELQLDEVTSKAWVTQNGKVQEGRSINKNLIYKLLHNRTYLGELQHREQWYPAEHPAIIDQEL